jgi:sulfate transport system permease protein
MSDQISLPNDRADWIHTPVGGGPVTRRVVLVVVAVLTALFLVAPLVLIVTTALSSGLGVFWRNLADPVTLNAVLLTLLTALVVVPINILFGLAAAWTVTKFSFRGRTFLIALIELPYSVSPIVAGVAYLFVYGSQGLFGLLLEAWDIKIMFAVPAIFLVSLFVTAPFVARELIPLMQEQGTDEEEAARMLGAGGWRVFWSVTLPDIKWALLYGVLLCNARAMGEFGAVSVVSGHIRGLTNTLPLQVDILYNEYNMVAAFATASILAGLALVTLVVKSFLEWRYADQLALTRR